MESQPQNPEFRINHENFHSCLQIVWTKIRPDRMSCPMWTQTLTLMVFLKEFMKKVILKRIYDLEGMHRGGDDPE